MSSAASTKWRTDIPTYLYECVLCGPFEAWKSIHDDTPLETHSCGNTVARIYTVPRLYGIGNPGQRTREVDAKERGWEKDLPAYRELRRNGLQPPGIDGAHDLTQRANDEWFVKTGGRFGVPEDRKDEINEMLALGVENPDNWNPVDQKREERARAS